MKSQARRFRPATLARVRDVVLGALVVADLPMRLSELVERADVSHTVVQVVLSQLRRERKIERVGVVRSGGWILARALVAPSPPTSRVRLRVVDPAEPSLVPGPGERRPCALESECLGRAVAAYPNARAMHCPSGCTSFQDARPAAFGELAASRPGGGA